MIGAAGAAMLLSVAAPALSQEVRQIDLAKAERPMPGSGDAVLVLRAHAPGMAGDNRILFRRIDPATGQLVKGPDGKPIGARITYSYTLFGGKKGERALRVAILPAGDYVLAGRTFNGSLTDSFCFGAPRFTLAPGAVVYVGDYEMFALAKMPDRERRNAMRYGADLEAARAALGEAYPKLAPSLTSWTPTNGTAIPCDGDEFTAYAVPGAAGPQVAPPR